MSHAPYQDGRAHQPTIAQTKSHQGQLISMAFAPLLELLEVNPVLAMRLVSRAYNAQHVTGEPMFLRVMWSELAGIKPPGPQALGSARWQPGATKARSRQGADRTLLDAFTELATDLTFSDPELSNRLKKYAEGAFKANDQPVTEPKPEVEDVGTGNIDHFVTVQQLESWLRCKAKDMVAACGDEDPSKLCIRVVGMLTKLADNFLLHHPKGQTLERKKWPQFAAWEKSAFIRRTTLALGIAPFGSIKDAEELRDYMTAVAESYFKANGKDGIEQEMDDVLSAFCESKRTAKFKVNQQKLVSEIVEAVVYGEETTDTGVSV